MKILNYLWIPALCTLMPAAQLWCAPLQTEVGHLLLYVEESPCTFLNVS